VSLSVTPFFIKLLEGYDGNRQYLSKHGLGASSNAARADTTRINGRPAQARRRRVLMNSAIRPTAVRLPSAPSHKTEPLPPTLGLSESNTDESGMGPLPASATPGPGRFVRCRQGSSAADLAQSVTFPGSESTVTGKRH